MLELLPNSGGVLVEGKVLTLLDLNTGLEPESTGYENIYLISFMRGYTKDQIDKFIDKVVEFSGLEPYLNQLELILQE